MNRYFYPMSSLGDNWIVKSLLSVLGSLLATEAQLVILVFVLVFVDLGTGIIAAMKRKDKLSSRIMSRTGVKLIEYILLLIASVAVANSFAILSWLANVTFLYIALTELVSIYENVSSMNPALAAYIDKLKKRIFSLTDE